MIGLMLAAATFIAAEPIDPERWLTVNDYPRSAVRYNGQTSQRIAITVDPDGRTAACQLVMAQSESFEKQVCNILKSRGRFRPAVESGHPTWGVYTMTISFLMSNKTSPSLVMYDVVVPVNRLPGTGVPQGVEIVQLVSADGKIEACNVTNPSAYAALNKLACKVATVLPIRSVTDHAGASVRAVVKQTVMFAVDPAASPH